jgi:Zn ribbon nucleic-acid-binding protein
MKLFSPWVWLMTLALSLLPLSAAPQAEEFRLSVRRNFGYSNGSEIRGSFTLSIVGEQSQIASVRFEIDGQTMEEVDQPPFSIKFQTDAYPHGWHELRAVVQTQDGRSLTTATRRFQFVSAAEESASMRTILLPILGMMVLVFAGMFLSVFINLRKKPLQLPPGAPRRYGLKGGAICPHCHRPFGLHWWSANLLVGAYDRCDFCGKWALQKPRSPQELSAAEAAEMQQETPFSPTTTAKDQLDEMLDDSRYLRD